MKTLLVIILILTFSNTFGQIAYDKDVTNQYLKLYKKLPRQLQIEFDKKIKDTSNENGLAIFTEYKCDTLNNNEENKKLDLKKEFFANKAQGYNMTFRIKVSF